MNNDRFTIPEPLLIASKRQVIYYPKVTKKKNKHGQRPQPSIKQARCSYEFKMIHLYGVHLGLLPQTPPDGLRLLSFISISTCSSKAFASGWPWSLSLSLLLLLCMHIQLLLDMCTHSGLHRVCAYIFNSLEICEQFIILLFWLVWDLCLHIQFPEDMRTSGLGVLTYEEVLGERSTRENDLLRSVLVTRRGAFLVIQHKRKSYVKDPRGKT